MEWMHTVNGEILSLSIDTLEVKPWLEFMVYDGTDPKFVHIRTTSRDGVVLREEVRT